MRLVNVPGSVWSYSTVGYNILALLLEELTGVSFFQLLQQRVLNPLGMSRTVWHGREVPAGRMVTGHDAGGRKIGRNDHWQLGHAAASGGLYSTAGDLSRYGRWLLDAYASGPHSDAATPLIAMTIREMHRTQRSIGMFSTTEGGHRARFTGMGLGWFTHTTCSTHRVAHNGALEGYFATVALVPEQDLQVIALTGSRISTERLAYEIAEKIVVVGDLAARSLAYDRALLDNTTAALKLGREWSVADYHRLYSPSFVSQEGDEGWKRVMGKLSKHGACTFERVLSVSGLHRARFLFRCGEQAVSAGGTWATGTEQFDSFNYSRLKTEPNYRPSNCTGP